MSINPLNSLYSDPHTDLHNLLTERLYQIVSLTKIGAAATDTTLSIGSLDEAQCALHEIIHRLASDAAEYAERDKMDRDRK